MTMCRSSLNPTSRTARPQLRSLYVMTCEPSTRLRVRTRRIHRSTPPWDSPAPAPRCRSRRTATPSASGSPSNRGRRHPGRARRRSMVWRSTSGAIRRRSRVNRASGSSCIVPPGIGALLPPVSARRERAAHGRTSPIVSASLGVVAVGTFGPGLESSLWAQCRRRAMDQRSNGRPLRGGGRRCVRHK